MSPPFQGFCCGDTAARLVSVSLGKVGHGQRWDRTKVGHGHLSKAFVAATLQHVSHRHNPQGCAQGRHHEADDLLMKSIAHLLKPFA